MLELGLGSGLGLAVGMGLGLGLGLRLRLGARVGLRYVLAARSVLVNRLAGYPHPSKPNPEHANPNPGERTCRMVKGAGMRDGALASVKGTWLAAGLGLG